jgi:hypothetical protein
MPPRVRSERTLLSKCANAVHQLAGGGVVDRPRHRPQGDAERLQQRSPREVVVLVAREARQVEHHHDGTRPLFVRQNVSSCCSSVRSAVLALSPSSLKRSRTSRPSRRQLRRAASSTSAAPVRGCAQTLRRQLAGVQRGVGVCLPELALATEAYSRPRRRRSLSVPSGPRRRPRRGSRVGVVHAPTSCDCLQRGGSERRPRAGGVLSQVEVQTLVGVAAAPGDPQRIDRRVR